MRNDRWEGMLMDNETLPLAAGAAGELLAKPAA